MATMKGLLMVFFVAVFLCANIQAQTTAFTYQGSLKDGANPANGNYDLEFKLFDLASGGAQQGSTVQRLNVAVANGIFTVSLDFGAGTLPGADRFIEIGLRVNGNPGGFQQMLPRQKINSAPYALRSLSAATADSVVAGGIPAGSGNYIQNSTSQQASSSFNISGDGTAAGTLSGNVVNTATQYNIIGERFFGRQNLYGIFAGLRAGEVNSTGDSNSYFGWGAGIQTTTGSFNTFLGREAGRFNSTGDSNSFIGTNAGQQNVTGSYNTIIGTLADFGSNNLINATAIGSRALVSQSNSLVLGSINGVNFATADTNVGIGTTAPIFKLHIVDPSNTGLRVQTNATGGTVASFGGKGSLQVDAPGIAGGRFSILENGNVGIGTASPGYNLHVKGENIRVEGNTTSTMPRFSLNYTGALTDNKKWQNYASADAQFGYLNFTALSDAEDFESTWMRVKRLFLDGMQVEFPQPVLMTQAYVASLGTAGSTTLCRNPSNQIATCSSSLRYKSNIDQFSQGMSFVNQLRPISFDWKDGGMKDVGFGAEDIAKIDSRFVTYNDKGEVEGVKYDRLSVAFVNAFKEQQAQIESQQKMLESQQNEIAAQKAANLRLQLQTAELKKVVCSLKPDVEICK